MKSKHRNDIIEINKQNSFNYGDMSTIVADNRSTSLFKDIDKMIGPRYKFTIENLIHNL